MTTDPKMPDGPAARNPVFVSEVIGDGADAHREVRPGARVVATGGGR